MNYKDEQKELFKSYLDNHVYKYWRSKEGQEYKQGLELILTSVCNTKCSYCYYKNFGKYLNDPCVSTKDNILKNAEKLFTWMNKEDMTPDSIDIFSGEPLNLPYIDDLMNILLHKPFLMYTLQLDIYQQPAYHLRKFSFEPYDFPLHIQ